MRIRVATDPATGQTRVVMDDRPRSSRVYVLRPIEARDAGKRPRFVFYLDPSDSARAINANTLHGGFVECVKSHHGFTRIRVNKHGELQRTQSVMVRPYTSENKQSEFLFIYERELNFE